MRPKNKKIDYKTLLEKVRPKNKKIDYKTLLEKYSQKKSVTKKRDKMDTDEFIQSLINDDTEQLNKLYQLPEWAGTIDFNKVYDSIKDINNPSVHYELGFIYHKGRDVEQDYEKALYYFQLSAEQVNRNSQYKLGRMYDMGKGVKQNHEKALRYYQLSAEQGDSDAQCNLGRLYDSGTGAKQNYEKALYYYQLSAEQGNATAQYNLGCMYGNGAGVEQDYEKAFHYYQLSAEQGYNDARKGLKRLIKNWGSGYLDYVIKTSRETKEEITKLRERVGQLEEEIVDLKYRPDGVGYLEAKEHFTLFEKKCY